MNMVSRLKPAALALLFTSPLAFALPAPSGLTASCSNQDTQIVLSWNQVPTAAGYCIYRLKPTPVQAEGTVSAGTATNTVSWVNPERAGDGRYDTGTYTSGGYSSNDWIQISFSPPRRVGAVGGFLAALHEHPNWIRGVWTLYINDAAVGTGNPGDGGRVVYRRLFEGTPTNASTVRVELTGGATDPGSSLGEIDVWEFDCLATNLGAASTTFVHSGVSKGVSYSYYVTAWTAGEESPLSNIASIKAGDRDDTNTSDLAAEFVAAPCYSSVRPGWTDLRPPRVKPPDPPGSLRLSGASLKWDLSPTEGASGDVEKYVVYRSAAGVTTNSAFNIQTNGFLRSKRNFPTMQGVLDGTIANVGDRARWANYAESDDIVDFGRSNFYAITRLVIHQSRDGLGAQQHHYRRCYLETSGGYMVGYNGILTGGGAGAIDFYSTALYCATVFSSTDDSGYATFGVAPKAAGAIPNAWIVGDFLVIHMCNGENNIRHAEYEILGFPVQQVGETPAGTAIFADLSSKQGLIYTYFVVAEDHAGNQSEPAFATFVIPARGTVVLVK